MNRSPLLATVTVALLFASPTSAQAVSGQLAPAAVAADTPVKTVSGTSFTLPQGWSLAAIPAGVILAPPETDSRIAIVEIATAKDATNAAASAWAVYRPAANRKVELVTPRAARNGWEESQVVDYETSPNEKAAIQSTAFRKGSGWTVLILDASQATLEKRGAAVGLVYQSLRPAGYTRENFAGRTPAKLDAARIAALQAFVKTSMQQLGIPGAAMALSQDGKIVFEGGFGVKTLGNPAPVDADTLFMVASNTKGMATLLLATLVDEGKLRWDQPVTQVYPAFRLGNHATTGKTLVKHLVCACTGLPRKDMESLVNTRPDTPASTTFTHLAATQPTSGFGEIFQYNNLMAAAAGYVGGHIADPNMEVGAAFDAAMQKRIFTPLGMTRTTFDSTAAQRTNHASPHGDSPMTLQPATATMELNYTAYPSRPAGGAWSSAHDMIRYVENELSEGVLPGGRRLVSSANLLERRKANVPDGEDSFYGMGLSGNTRWGVPIFNHGGSLAGYKTDIVFIPSAGVGAVILTNADNGQALLRPFQRRLAELLYNGQPEADGNVAAAAARVKASNAKFRELLTIPAASTDVLAQRYTSPELGLLTVEARPAATKFHFVSTGSQVASRKNPDGTISFITIDPTKKGVELVAGTAAGKRTLTLRDAQHEYIYTEVP